MRIPGCTTKSIQCYAELIAPKEWFTYEFQRKERPNYAIDYHTITWKETSLFSTDESE